MEENLIQKPDEPATPTGDGGNGDGKEVPQVCGTCNWWWVQLVHPQTKQGMGGCRNEEDEDAPLGVVTMGYCPGCPGWKLREQKQVIEKVPAGTLERMKSRQFGRRRR